MTYDDAKLELFEALMPRVADWYCSTTYVNEKSKTHYLVCEISEGPFVVLHDFPRTPGIDFMGMSLSDFWFQLNLGNIRKETDNEFLLNQKALEEGNPLARPRHGLDDVRRMGLGNRRRHG